MATVNPSRIVTSQRLDDAKKSEEKTREYYAKLLDDSKDNPDKQACINLIQEIHGKVTTYLQESYKLHTYNNKNDFANKDAINFLPQEVISRLEHTLHYRTLHRILKEKTEAKVTFRDHEWIDGKVAAGEVYGEDFSTDSYKLLPGLGSAVPRASLDQKRDTRSATRAHNLFEANIINGPYTNFRSVLNNVNDVIKKTGIYIPENLTHSGTLNKNLEFNGTELPLGLKDIYGQALAHCLPPGEPFFTGTNSYDKVLEIQLIDGQIMLILHDKGIMYSVGRINGKGDNLCEELGATAIEPSATKPSAQKKSAAPAQTETLSFEEQLNNAKQKRITEAVNKFGVGKETGSAISLLIGVDDNNELKNDSVKFVVNSTRLIENYGLSFIPTKDMKLKDKIEKLRYKTEGHIESIKAYQKIKSELPRVQRQLDTPIIGPNKYEKLIEIIEQDLRNTMRLFDQPLVSTSSHDSTQKFYLESAKECFNNFFYNHSNLDFSKIPNKETDIDMLIDLDPISMALNTNPERKTQILKSIGDDESRVDNLRKYLNAMKYTDYDQPRDTNVLTRLLALKTLFRIQNGTRASAAAFRENKRIDNAKLCIEPSKS